MSTPQTCLGDLAILVLIHIDFFKLAFLELQVCVSTCQVGIEQATKANAKDPQQNFRSPQVDTPFTCLSFVKQAFAVLTPDNNHSLNGP